MTDRSLHFQELSPRDKRILREEAVRVERLPPRYKSVHPADETGFTKED